MMGLIAFKNYPKNLDLSSKTDLDFWDCFRRNKMVYFLGREKPMLQGCLNNLFKCSGNVWERENSTSIVE